MADNPTDGTPDSTTETAIVQDEKVQCEVYSRVVGYVRPVKSWNKGKKHEFGVRVTYEVPGEEVLEAG